MSEAVNFQGIIGFLNRSRLRVALSADPYISLVYIQQFWDTVHQDTDIEPHVLRATVNNTEIAISSETIRAALTLGGVADDPMSYPGTLIMGCFQRMGYRGIPNDTQARKGGLVGEWMYFMHVIIQCLSPRKAGTDGLKIALQAAMVALTLNKRFNFALYIYRELVMQITPAEAFIPVQTPLFGHLINPDYVEPPNDNWFHPEELAQGHGQNVQQPQQPQQQPQQQQIPVQQPIPIPEQVPIQQAQVNIHVNEPVQEEVVQEHEHDLGMNMDDFVDDAVNSPIHEAEGNVVKENDSSSSLSETILPVSEETDSDVSRDFCSDHYERLAEIQLANAGKRIKSQARRPRQKSVRDPPFGSVLGKRTLVDESSDSDKDTTFVASLIVTPPRSKDSSPVITHVPLVITPSPTVPQSLAGPSKPSDSERITFLESQVLTLQTQVDTLVSTDSQRQLVIQTQSKQIADMQALVSKLVEGLDAQGELRIHDTCHTESIQRKDDEDNDPTGNAEGDRQYADVNPISTVQGESKSQTIEENKDASGVNEEVLLLEFFADSEEEEAEKIECLDDIDELFKDIEDDVSDNDMEEGEIMEIEIEKNKDNVTYEGSDGLNVPYNFIQDDVIPEFTYEGVTDSMDFIEDITVPEDTAESKMDTDDDNDQSNIDAEADITHTVSPKVNEEPVMYRNTGMTKEQWREVVNSWMKVLPKCQAQPAQKEKYVNKERCVGRIISWFYDNDTKLFAIKRSDGVQYLKPRIKYFNTFPRCEMNGLASKPLINRSKFGLADVIANLIKREGGSGNTSSNQYVHKIPLKKIPQDFLGNMKWWYVDVNTGEARIEDKDNKVIVCFYDAMNLINFSKKDQRTLRKNEIMFIDEWKEQGLQYKRVLEICRRYGVHAGSRLPDN
ncbi:hypothetical protein L1987_60212 [Smallanthus sonchifolius]|uniref:Uncharacterized protein n=1 Tax=Smallanthus sonchifolius TaxID=185202 RepID=A0ACB9D7V4_9ASTR|nr:hypothetical protein L1987_60212 [Smallanthus sonchifolius]